MAQSYIRQLAAKYAAKERRVEIAVSAVHIRAARESDALVTVRPSDETGNDNFEYCLLE